MLTVLAYDPFQSLQNISDKMLHNITFFSLLIALVGILYASFAEEKNQLNKLLCWLLQAAIPMLSAILITIVPLSLFILFFSSYLLDSDQVNELVLISLLSAGMIGVFHGVFAGPPIYKATPHEANSMKMLHAEDMELSLSVPADKPVPSKESAEAPLSDAKKFSLRLPQNHWRKWSPSGMLSGFTIGFVSIFTYWFLMMLIIQGIDENALTSVLSFSGVFGLIGGIAGFIWRGRIRCTPASLKFKINFSVKAVGSWVKTFSTEQIDITSQSEPERTEASDTGTQQSSNEQDTSKVLKLAPTHTGFSKRDSITGFLFWGVISLLFVVLLFGLPSSNSTNEITSEITSPANAIVFDLGILLTLIGWVTYGIAAFTIWAINNTGAFDASWIALAFIFPLAGWFASGIATYTSK